MNTPLKKQISQVFRKEPTESERLLWEKLRARHFMGLKFRRQYVFKGFVLDFFCPQVNLAIEIDGGIHDMQQEYDRNRQELLELHGIEFFRIKSRQVEENIGGVLVKLREKIFLILEQHNT